MVKTHKRNVPEATDAISRAASLFAQQAQPWLVDKAFSQVNRGALRWVSDAEHDSIVGLVFVDPEHQQYYEAVVIVDLEREDFEVNTEWETG